ncbi:siderophore-interacting protein [uncultured Leifsonia sp.]|uniref:siderophore-interacting protein n=1 Tax=uncultured Leifsonia sp. TaxID=340359 RepID=UPI0025F15724|nr:siderophore-interacting protein [uncultured Leifsonia sp.]
MPVLAPPLTDRPAYRPYRAAVSDLRRLSPGFLRVSLTCPEFETFGTERLDQRIKLVFPLADGSFSPLDAGDWYDQWRALPDHRRNPFRTYTVRDVSPEECRVDIDFVVHGDGGPAAAWLSTAAVGDELVVIGPDALSPHSGVGIDWRPGTATDLLLVGDETAAPAIASILEALPPNRRAHAFIEVPCDADALPLAVGAHVEVTWLARAGGEHGSRLIPAVTAWLAERPQLVARAAADRPQPLDEVDVDSEILWERPESAGGGFYAWIAGESGVVKTLRRLLVRGHGIDRGRVAFMGYWRLGRAERG